MIITFDLDGTLGDLLTPWLKRYNKDFNDNLTPEDITDWNIHNFVKPEAKQKIYDYLKTGEIYDDVEPYPYMQSAVKNYTERKDTIAVCTATSNKAPVIEAKCKWLKKHFPLIPESNYIFTNNKGLIFSHVFYDDYAKNLYAYKESNPDGVAILVKQPHNHKEHLNKEFFLLNMDVKEEFWIDK